MQQASLDDVIKEVRDQLKKFGKSQIADLPDFKGLEVSVAECLKAEVELKGRVEALESGALQPSYVKNTKTGVHHSVVDGSDRTTCGWDFGRATKITLHSFVPDSASHLELCPRCLPKLRLRLLARERECTREHEVDSD